MMRDFIVANRAELLSRCCDMLRSTYPDRPADELCEDLPVICDEIADALDPHTQGDEAAPGEAFGAQTSPAHGARRWHQGFAAFSASAALELISGGKVAARGRTADVLRRSLARILRLADQSLVEARLAAGSTASRSWLSVHGLLEQTASAAFPDRGITIAIEAEPALEVEGDPQLLGSAIGNLVQNAIKFTKDDQPIQLRGFDSGESIVVEVEDRCGGLPEGKIERMFDAFEGAPGERRGAGLGLAIALKAAQAHGGTLTARSLPGIGCVFALRLPRSQRIHDAMLPRSS